MACRTCAPWLDAVYRERAHLLALLATHYPAHIQPDADEPDWVVLYLTIPKNGAFPGADVVSERGYTVSSVDADLLERKWYANGNGYYKRQNHLPEPRGYLHRVIAERIFGVIPQGYEVDHIDRDPLNNSRWNLRLASSRVQKLNQGHLSVRQRSNKRWQAMRNADGKQVSLGMHDTREAAEATARVDKDKLLREAFASGEVIHWTTQATWHIGEDDLELFRHVRTDVYEPWDGHTTEAKYERIAALTDLRGRRIP